MAWKELTATSDFLRSTGPESPGCVYLNRLEDFFIQFLSCKENFQGKSSYPTKYHGTRQNVSILRLLSIISYSFFGVRSSVAFDSSYSDSGCEQNATAASPSARAKCPPKTRLWKVWKVTREANISFFSDRAMGGPDKVWAMWKAS